MTRQKKLAEAAEYQATVDAHALAIPEDISKESQAITNAIAAALANPEPVVKTPPAKTPVYETRMVTLDDRTWTAIDKAARRAGVSVDDWLIHELRTWTR